jgi:hypothetical protein
MLGCAGTCYHYVIIKKVLNMARPGQMSRAGLIVEAGLNRIPVILPRKRQIIRFHEIWILEHTR